MTISRLVLAAVAAGGVCALASAPALAQGVPVTDSKGLTKMVDISSCFHKIQQSNDSRVSPTQGIKASNTTPGSAGQAAQVGSTDVTGASGADASGMSTTPTIGGQDYGSLFATATSSNASAFNGISTTQRSLNSLNAGTLSQALTAENSVTSALQSNVTTQQGIQGQVGTLSQEQQSFDQNTASRVSNIALWNQAIQSAVIGTRFNNQRLINKNAGVAAVTNTMTFVPTRVTNNSNGAQDTNGCDTIGSNTTTTDQNTPSTCAAQTSAKGQ